MNRLWSLVFLLTPAIVHADEPARPPPSPVAYDFSDELVTGDMVRPDVELLRARKRGSTPSLISLRATFVPELLGSIENL